MIPDGSGAESDKRQSVFISQITERNRIPEGRTAPRSMPARHRAVCALIGVSVPGRLQKQPGEGKITGNPCRKAVVG